MIGVPKWGNYRKSILMPFLLITRYRVGVGNYGLMTYNMFQHFEEQSGVWDYYHIVLFVWNTISVNEGSENKRREKVVLRLIKDGSTFSGYWSWHQICGRDGVLQSGELRKRLGAEIPLDPENQECILAYVNLNSVSLHPLAGLSSLWIWDDMFCLQQRWFRELSFLSNQGILKSKNIMQTQVLLWWPIPTVTGTTLSLVMQGWFFF